MTVVNAWCGAVTAASVRVTAKVSSSATARLAVADNPLLTGPVFSEPVVPSAQNVVSMVVGGLQSDVRYFWAVEHDAVVDEAFTGTFATHPPLGLPASFTFAAASCAGSGQDVIGPVLFDDGVSNHAVFDTIRSRATDNDWLFFAHLGDLQYYDLGSDLHGIIGGGSLTNYRRSYDDVLLQPRQHQLYRDVPLAYVWDDHDFGPNNSDGTLPTKGNAQQVFRERVPHYPLAASAAIYHSFQVGRVLFIASDTRSDRSPNADPDTAAKTMLGTAQKQWMRDLLSTSGAAFLVWLLPSQWMGLSSDSFAVFTAEREELSQMFIDLGWRDRMCIVSGDVHSLGIDTGGNSPGGIPVFQFAAMDASFAAPETQYDTGPTQPGRNQYGTVAIEDDGTTVTVTGTGWAGTSLWRSHTFVVGEVAPPPPPPEPEPGPVAIATIRNRVTWLGCRLGDGRIIAELPDITGQVSRVIGRYTSASLSTPIPRGGPGAVPLPTVLQATQPARTMIVAVVNDIPTWAGIPLPRQRGTAANMPIGCVSVEGYLQHRFVRDHEWVQQDEASVIAAGLLADAADLPGIGDGIGFSIDAPATGRLRDRTFLATDHKTVYEALTELMAVQSGPEWTIDIDWADSTMTAVRMIARVRPRLGLAAGSPAAIFETTAESVFASQGGADATYELEEDFSGDLYGNYVVAYSSGEGEDQPQSAPAVDTDAMALGVPIWERHYQPSTGITDQGTLDDHAQAELARIRNGSAVLAITARWSTYPRYGVDWALGDDIGWQLTGHGHPNGFTGQGRAVGFVLDAGAGTIQPLLQEEG